MDVSEAAEKKGAVANGNGRQLLGQSERNNGVVARKPYAREITSRYKAAITPATSPRPRCQSPNTTLRTVSDPGQNKRAQSAERRRPTTPSSPSRPSTPPHDVEVHRRLMGGRNLEALWPSMRSLSVSFQSDSFSVPFSKREKPIITNGSSDHTLKNSANVVRKCNESAVVPRKVTPERKRTPLRGKNALDQSENSKPVENSNARVIDQHRWPSRMRGKLSANALTRSVDLTDKPVNSTSLQLPGRGVSPIRRMPISEGVGRGARQVSLDRRARNEMGSIHSVDEASSRLSGSSSFVSSSASLSLNSSEKGLMRTHSTRSQSSPIRESRNPPSPSKATLLLPSSTRGMPSPSRTRPSTPSSTTSSVSSRSSCSSSVLSFVADVRKGKKGANHVEDAHQLRLLYNRHLQWLFINARADSTSSIQKLMAENTLHNVWHTTSELRDSVTMKRINLLQLRQEMKLKSILEEQMTYLDDWSVEEREHSSCLSGTIEALEASILHLPVTGGARAEIQTVKVAVSSAVDVMQIMGSSICSILSRVEGMNRLISELASVAAQERAMLDKCRDLLASTAALQVHESSLRTHLIQLKQPMHKGKQSILSNQKFARQ